MPLKTPIRRRATTRPAHDYARCRDKDCERLACQAWREGRAEGFEDGYEDGYADGIEAGRRADR
ncbi:MAG TPA: hypothetical protein VMF87_08035 [Streptosporangiaceae bacterium]|nr:hypothetical protein [Streptosporangiaceae bacterium]